MTNDMVTVLDTGAAMFEADNDLTSVEKIIETDLVGE